MAAWHKGVHICCNMLQSSISQYLSPDVPLCMVHLSDVPPEVTGKDIINNYFHVEKPGTRQQILVRGSGQVSRLF